MFKRLLRIIDDGGEKAIKPPIGSDTGVSKAEPDVPQRADGAEKVPAANDIPVPPDHEPESPNPHVNVRDNTTPAGSMSGQQNVRSKATRSASTGMVGAHTTPYGRIRTPQEEALSSGVLSSRRRVVPAFQLSHVYKVYGNGQSQVVALRDVNAEIPAKEMVAVIGVSGRGKSTLLNVLGGLDFPDKGSVYFHGRMICYDDEAYMHEYRRNNVGFIFQEHNLVSYLPAWKNVALPMVLKGSSWWETRRFAIQWLERMGLKGKHRSFPSQLSGGQKQRVSVARAFATRPSIILADEPTGDLDEATGKTVMDMISRFQSETGCTVVMVTHDRRMAAKYCKTIFEFTDTGIMERRR